MSYTIHVSCRFQAPPEEVFRFHDDPANLTRITPSFHSARIARFDPPGKGSRVRVALRLFRIIPATLEMEFVVYDPPKRLTDEIREGMFPEFRHQRDFQADGGGTLLTETVQYTPPFGTLGRLVDPIAIAPALRSMFAYRHRRMKELLDSVH